jgi:hypothetical protein
LYFLFRLVQALRLLGEDYLRPLEALEQQVPLGFLELWLCFPLLLLS